MAPAGSGQEALDLAAHVVLVLLILLPAIWHNRQAIRVPAPGCSLQHRLSPPPGPVGPVALAATAGVLGYFYPPASLNLRAWLMLALLLLLGALGLVHASPDPRWRNLWPAASWGQWGTGLLFFGGAFFVRILFPGPVAPDWTRVSELPSLTGTLYRVLGEERAILVPITLSCLLPVAVWWVGRRLVGPRVALAAGLLTVLHPYAIWSTEFATALGLTPLLMILLVTAARQVWKTQAVGAWLGMGLLWGLLWTESHLVRFLLLCWAVSLILAVLWMLRLGQGGRLPLHRGLWTAAGLITGLGLWGVPWHSLTALDTGGGHWAWSPHLPQLMSFWFQPYVLELPFAMTLFLPLDGILVLLGLGVCVTAWRRIPILAAAALGWLAALLWPVPDPDRMLEIAHGTLGLSLLLATVGIGLLTRLVQDLLPETTPRLQAALPWMAALLLVIQFPGGVLGENLALNLVQGLRGGDAAVTVEAESVPSLQAVPVSMDPAEWPATLVWRSEGVCEAVEGRPRGIAIDLEGNRVWVSGGRPGFLVALDLDTGSWTGHSYGAGLHEPADIMLRGPDALYLIDAVHHQIMRFRPSTGAVTGVSNASLLAWPRGFGASPEGGFLVADTAHSRIVRLDAHGIYLDHLQDTPGFRHVVQPTDVLATGGMIWIVDPEVPILMEMTTGLKVDVVHKGWTFNGPHLADLPDDTFLLSDPVAGTVLHLAATGDLLSRLVLPAGLQLPVALDAASAGDDWLLAVTEDARCQTWLLRLERNG